MCHCDLDIALFTRGTLAGHSLRLLEACWKQTPGHVGRLQSIAASAPKGQSARIGLVKNVYKYIPICGGAAGSAGGGARDGATQFFQDWPSRVNGLACAGAPRQARKSVNAGAVWRRGAVRGGRGAGCWRAAGNRSRRWLSWTSLAPHRSRPARGRAADDADAHHGDRWTTTTPGRPS